MSPRLVPENSTAGPQARETATTATPDLEHFRPYIRTRVPDKRPRVSDRKPKHFGDFKKLKPEVVPEPEKAELVSENMSPGNVKISFFIETHWADISFKIGISYKYGP